MKKFLIIVFGLFLAIGTIFFASGLSQVNAASITIISPNGGEKWEIGKTYPISWTATASDLASGDTISITLYKGSNFMEVLFSGLSNTATSTNWTIPQIATGDDYRVRVISNRSGSTIMSAYSQFFSIVATPAPSITVISPNGGEKWEIGSSHTIIWQSTNAPLNSPVKLYLVNSNGGLIFNISGSNTLQPNGSFSWKIPADLGISVGSYKVEAQLINPTGSSTGIIGSIIAKDQSDAAFDIVASTIPSVTFEMDVKWGNVLGEATSTTATNFDGSISIAATSGVAAISLVKTESFDNYSAIYDKVTSKNNPVSWKSLIFGHWDGVKVKVSAPKEAVVTIQTTQGTITKTVQELYDLKVAIIQDVGNGREIVIGETSAQPSQPFITVISPNGGEKWEIGKRHEIKFKIAEGKKGYVDLLVFPEGSEVNYVFNDYFQNTELSAGSYSSKWTIPQTVSTGKYQAKVYLKTLPVEGVVIASDASDAPFSIVAAETLAPIVSSINPSSGPIGIKAALHGSNFTLTNNIVQFGPVAIPSLGSNLTPSFVSFIVPKSGPSSCTIDGICTKDLIQIEPGKTYPVKVINANGTSNSVEFTVTQETIPSDFLTLEMFVKWGNVFGKVADKTKTNFDGSISVSSAATSTVSFSPSVTLLHAKKFEDHDAITSRNNPVSWKSWIYSHWDGAKVKISAPKESTVTIQTTQGTITKTVQELYDLQEAIIQDVGQGREIVIGETPKMRCFPDGTIIKLPNDHKVYVIKDCRKHWIETAEEFKEEGHEWENIEETSSPVLQAYQDYVQATGNLLRAIGKNRVYIIKNGKRLWVPTISAFNAQGLKWNDIQDTTESSVDQYPEANLVRAAGDSRVYFLTKSGKKKHILNPNVFVAYDHKWSDILEVTPTELNAFSDVVLVKAKDDFRVYKVANGKKRWVKTLQAFNRLGYSWDDVVEVNDTEVNEHGTETPIE